MKTAFPAVAASKVSDVNDITDCAAACETRNNNAVAIFILFFLYAILRATVDFCAAGM